jgi:hypothetical protein
MRMPQKGKDGMLDGALEIIARELNCEGGYLHRFDERALTESLPAHVKKRIERLLLAIAWSGLTE